MLDGRTSMKCRWDTTTDISDVSTRTGASASAMGASTCSLRLSLLLGIFLKG